VNWLVQQSNMRINSNRLIWCLCFFPRQMSCWNHWAGVGGGVWLLAKKHTACRADTHPRQTSKFTESV